MPKLNILKYDCQACGACCAYSETWPELQQDESDASGIPPHLVDWANLRMRCKGDRCVALNGELGKNVTCAIYAQRPLVCRNFEPGSKACLQAREWSKIPR
jgi:uncharacterized protein